MKCKFCQAELPEEDTVCPVCGKDNGAEPEAAAETEELAKTEEAVEAAEPVEAEETLETEEVTETEEAAEAAEPEAADTEAAEEPAAPANRRKDFIRTVAGILAGALLLGVLTVAAYFNKKKGEGVQTKASYTASDTQVQAVANEAVATLGGATLTNGQLQIYYWMQFYDFLNYYGYYMPFDYAQPLDTQVMDEQTGMTWQQYFLQIALESWQRYQVLSLLAEDADFTLPEEMQQSLDTAAQHMEEMALEYGYENADEMIRTEMGPGSSIEDYVHYLSLYYNGYQYFAAMYEKLEATDAEIEAYFAEHEAEFAGNGISREGMIDVRHILIMPEGGTTDENGITTYSDEEWEACRAEAQAILDEWLAGEATEDSFADLAYGHSADGGSSSNGGLYSGVTVGKMVEPFENWCFDESRVAGDYGLVQTPYGYHIMYFVGDTWYSAARDALFSDRANNMLENALTSYPMEVDYQKIFIGSVDLGAAE